MYNKIISFTQLVSLIGLIFIVQLNEQYRGRADQLNKENILLLSEVQKYETLFLKCQLKYELGNSAYYEGDKIKFK